MISKNKLLTKMYFYMRSIIQKYSKYNEQDTLHRMYFVSIALLKKVKQAEAEVVPSSSLVDLEVEIWVEVGVGVEVGVWAWVKMQLSFLTFSVRWVDGRRNGD